MIKDCLLKSMMEDPTDSCGGKISISTHLINGHTVVCCWNENRFYGDLLRQWAIDGNNVSDRKNKYTGRPLIFDCACGLIAAPEYPSGCSVLTDFFNRLDIDPEPFRTSSGGTRYLVEFYKFCSYYPSEFMKSSPDWQEWIKKNLKGNAGREAIQGDERVKHNTED